MNLGKWKWYDFMGVVPASVGALSSKDGRKDFWKHLGRGTLSGASIAGLALGGLGAAGALGGGAAAGAGSAGAGAAGAGAAGAGTAAGLGSAATTAGTAGAAGAGAAGASGGGMSSLMSGLKMAGPFLQMMGGGQGGQQQMQMPAQFTPFGGGQIASLNPYQQQQTQMVRRQSPFINGGYYG